MPTATAIDHTDSATIKIVSYSQRVNSMKKPGDEQKQIQLAKQYAMNLRRKLKKAGTLEDKLAIQHAVKEAENVLRQLRMNVFGLRDALERRESNTTPQVTEKLFAQYGDRRFEVASFEDASEKWCQFRDQTGAGASEIGEGVFIVNQKGEKVARVSYNGKVWGPGEWKSDDTPLYNPYA